MIDDKKVKKEVDRFLNDEIISGCFSFIPGLKFNPVHADFLAIKEPILGKYAFCSIVNKSCNCPVYYYGNTDCFHCGHEFCDALSFDELMKTSAFNLASRFQTIEYLEEDELKYWPEVFKWKTVDKKTFSTLERASLEEFLTLRVKRFYENREEVKHKWGL